mmetsp:Transcript_28952/g.69588  ORF Transcript_28952/g.69588 Transcript_28952/m.69588 type:complete len:82 (-) Transcript_28952:54-299(-)
MSNSETTCSILLSAMTDSGLQRQLQFLQTTACRSRGWQVGYRVSVTQAFRLPLAQMMNPRFCEVLSERSIAWPAHGHGLLA